MLKLKFNFLLCLSILSLLCFAAVKSDCVIKYPDDIEIAPIYTRWFGRYALELPFTRSNIILQNDETIQAKCRTTFTSINQRNINHYYDYGYDSYHEMENQSLIMITCVQNTLQFVGTNVLQNNVLECKKLNWTLYEDLRDQSWCKMDTEFVTTLLLATESKFSNYMLAEMCFDLNNWSLQAITYNITFPDENVEILRDIQKTKLQTADLLGENLQNLKSIHDYDLTESVLQQQLEEMRERNSWLHLANYELSPIVQGKLYKNYFKEYSNILNIIWWTNLRLGNWKRFIDTLENYAYNNSFQLYTGTSGVVRKPINNMADLSKDLKIKFNYKEKPVPAYIVFCDDICNEIPWLQGISESFKFSTAGIIFCCSPESVQQNNILNGFPMKVLTNRAKNLTVQENLTVFEDSTINYEKTTILDTEIDSTTVTYNEIKSVEVIENSGEERNEDYEQSV